MLRSVSLVCAVLIGLTLHVSSFAQAPAVEPLMLGDWCCTVYGQLGNEYSSFCCKHYNLETARKCAEKRREDAGYGPVETPPTEESNCMDLDCLPPPLSLMVPYAAVPPQCKVRLKCCGCDGCIFYVTEKASTWCKALEKAQRTAQVIGNSKYRGLRWSCVCNPCQQSTHSPILQKMRLRLFR